MAEATNPISTASNPRVGEDVGRVTILPSALWQALDAEAEIWARETDVASWLAKLSSDPHSREKLDAVTRLCFEEGFYRGAMAAIEERSLADSINEAASAPSPEAGAGGDLGELERLSAAASQGKWSLGRNGRGDQFLDAAGARGHDPCGSGMPWEGFAAFVVEMDEEPFPTGPANAAFVVALVNAYRSGKLVASTDRDINPEVVLSEPQAITIDYVNWRGEQGRRRILPTGRIVYGATEWHPRHQWLLEAMDLDKSAVRLFAFVDMQMLAPSTSTPKATPKSTPDQTPVDPQMTVEEWRLITTAPRDGTLVAIKGTFLGGGAWESQGWFETSPADRRWYDAADDEPCRPTHWHPLAPSDAPSTTEADR